MRSIAFTGSQFEIAFQVTYQAMNFDEFRLRELGVTVDDLEWLIVKLRSVRDEANRATQVRIVFHEPFVRPAPEIADKSIICHKRESEDGVQISLPVIWASRWPLLTGLVMSSLSRRELFLRTGYQWHEMESVVQRFERSC